MIRSTLNQSIKTVKRSGIIGESIETYIDASGATKAVTEETWNASGTGSPVHSNEHWDGTIKTQ